MEKDSRKTVFAARFLHTISLLSFFAILYSTSVEGRASFTIKEKFLLGYQIEEDFQTDWIGCLMKCLQHSECVSYNYHTRKNSCQLNSHGIEYACMASHVLHSETPYIFHQVKPVTTGRLASPRTSQKCSCNCGADNQCINRDKKPGLGDTPEQPASSCREILKQKRDVADGPYYLETFPSITHTYCHMTELPGCGGGGWTLVIKMDGNKQTFRYNSTLWGEMKAYEPQNGVNLLETETLLPTYWSTNFTRLCLGMTHDGDKNWIAINHSAAFLYSVLNTPGMIETDLNVSQWKSLLRNSSLQTACTVQGFNIEHPLKGTASARIGITGLNNCNSTSESRIGFGTKGSFYGMDGSNTCGNEARNKPDNGERSIKAFGYIFIQ